MLYRLEAARTNGIFVVMCHNGLVVGTHLLLFDTGKPNVGFKFGIQASINGMNLAQHATLAIGGKGYRLFLEHYNLFIGWWNDDESTTTVAAHGHAAL